VPLNLGRKQRWCLRSSGGHSWPAITGAVFRAADAQQRGLRPTTSSTGSAVAQRIWRTSPSCAAPTTASCTTVAGTSPWALTSTRGSYLLSGWIRYENPGRLTTGRSRFSSSPHDVSAGSGAGPQRSSWLLRRLSSTACAPARRPRPTAAAAVVVRCPPRWTGHPRCRRRTSRRGRPG